MDNKNFVANEEATFVASAATAANSETQAAESGSNLAQQNGVPAGPPPDYFTDDLPPAYQVASALPTYEEAELTKGMM